MKTAAVSFVFVLACAFSSEAQITATLNRLENGADEVKLRNNSTISLVAFVVTVKQRPISPATSTAPLVVFSDPLAEPAAKPLLPNEERVVVAVGFIPRGGVPARNLLNEPIVIAGIFADGTTTGDANLLNRLIWRRSNILMAVETTIETLADAGRHNISREQLINQFKKMSDSVNRWYVPPEQQVVRTVYQSIIGKLMSLTEGHPGSPFPPSDFVSQETSMLNRKRVTLLESQPSLADAVLITTRTPR